MRAYYNEIDPYAAQWLRNLIEAGHITPGDVDERSIEDVTPKDLHGYTQCHFFAGIGVWSHALRKSGWTDDRPVWTGSCPCQPFSAAGKGGGFADERHLWPAFHHLIRVCRPPIVIGEQVASKDGLSWLDLVSSDMEGEGYAFGAVDTCAAGVGAPHIRQRLYWVADSDSRQRDGFAVVRGDERDGADARWAQGGGLADSGHDECGGRNTVRDPDGEHDGTPSTGEGAGAERERPKYDASVRSTGDGVADTDGPRLLPGTHARVHSGEESTGPRDGEPERRGELIGLGNTDGKRARGISGEVRGAEAGEGRWTSGDDAHAPGANDRPGPTNGFWGASDWLFCKDGKWRPVEPGTFPLAHGATARVGRLRAYGNAIVAQQAQAFIEAVMNNG